jgi:hypothetical protein
MKRTRSLVVGIAAITGLVFAAPGGLGAAVAKPAPPPTLTYVDYMVPGSVSTSVTGYTIHGVAAGTYTDALGATHGFIDADISDAAITVVDAPPGSTDAAVTSINDSGSTTGTYWTGTVRHGFLRAPDGALTVIDDPAAPTEGDLVGTVASQVSNTGVVVGYSFVTDNDGITLPVEPYFAPSTVSHGFVWKDGDFTTFDAPKAYVDPAYNSGTRVLGLNTAEAMVGEYTFLRRTDGTSAGFLVTGRFKTLVEPTVPTNWCGFTTPMAINDAGVIVGSAGNGCSGGHPFGFTYTKNRFTQVISSNEEITNINRVSSINANGELSGSWATPVENVPYDPDVPVRGFIAHH